MDSLAVISHMMNSRAVIPHLVYSQSVTPQLIHSGAITALAEKSRPLIDFQMWYNTFTEKIGVKGVPLLA